MILKTSQLQIIGKVGSNGIDCLTEKERKVFDEINQYLQEFFGKTIYEEFNIKENKA